MWTSPGMRWVFCGVVVGLIVAPNGACGSCGDGNGGLGGNVAAGADRAPGLPPADAVELADRREPVRWTATDERGKAFEALLHRRARRAESVDRLGRLLSDPDAAVRRAAAFGLGAFDRDPAAELWLIGRTAAETDPDTQGAVLEALGRVTVDAGAAPLADGLDSADARVQGGACAGWARRSLRGIDPPAAVVRAAAIIAGAPGPSAAQVPCVWFLATVRPAALDAPAAEQVDAALSSAALAESDELRRLTVRALSKRPTAAALDGILARTADPDWRVAAEAFRAASGHPEAPRRAGALAKSVDSRLARATQEDALPVGPERHVLLEAVRSLAPVARETVAGRSAAAVVVQASVWRSAGRGRPATDAAKLECAAAEVLDLAHGWPNDLERCGGDLIGESERALAALRVVSAATSTKPDQVLAYLRPLLPSTDARVAEAALTTLGTVPGAAATELLAVTLAGARSEGVVAAACDAARERAAKAKPAAGELALLARATSAALDRMIAGDALESIQSCVRAAATVAPAPTAAISALAETHHNTAVRAAAAAALDQLGAAVPPPRPAPQPRLSSASPLEFAKTFVRVETDRGAFTLEVDGILAPTTAARFLALVGKGFYNGLTFHRVVPGFVVQGGDPSGDGYGGPGYSQRCEESAVPYERGTVGMALAGRDTGGSQFFITYGREPRLDGEYTVFARVVSGMEVVDALEAGDRMLSVRRVKAPARASKPRI